MTFWCENLLIDGKSLDAVRIHTGLDGRIDSIHNGVPASPGDIRLGTVVPGMANAHSHSFHRALRGRTHSSGGNFWTWRDSMYTVARALGPELYFDLARAVFAEMLVSGWTAVGEFHYLHHRSDGTPYPQQHAMELAIVEAARDVGIRLTLLDTCYLSGGIKKPLTLTQRAFSDGSASAWLRRWHFLRERLENDSDQRVTLGAALHSVRAVSSDAIREILEGLPPDVPLHIHLSEQPQENDDCMAEYGCTPTELLESLGALTPRLSVIHATHLSSHDLSLLGSAAVTVVMCPTTEADLGDGIGPAHTLAKAGARIAIGSDQNAVIDPLLEIRALEMGERLASGQRSRFEPAELMTAATTNGYASLGLGNINLSVGAWCDLVELSLTSTRTIGAHLSQLPFAATASDVTRVIVGGKVVAENGRLHSNNASGAEREPANLLEHAISALDHRTKNEASL